VKYLSKETTAELQMGAVSGLADVQSPQATAALIAAIPRLTEGNRNLALDALLRDTPRALALLEAIEARTIDPALLGEARMTKLKNHADGKVRDRARGIR
jgi:hypothetical protein